jgi:hypothetical protein
MAREAVAEQDDQQGGTYRLELVSCGKPNCTRCAEGPAHGPYWYRYYRRGGKVVSKYVGKTLPASPGRGDAGADAAGVLSGAAGPAASIQDRVRGAYRALAAEPGDFVWLSDLRERLPGIPPGELDAALDGMYRDQDINLVPSADQHPEVLTDARRAAAVRAGGKGKHRISIQD